jgi:HEAT repeat protein
MDPHAEIAELFAEACAADADDAAAAVMTLHGRPERATLDAAIELLTDARPRARAVAADVLGQLGAGEPVFIDERLEALTGRVAVETEGLVLADLALALGHLDDARAIEPLLSLVGHADADVREGAAVGLMRHDDPRVLAAEILLSADPAGEVRNWATFAIGAQSDVDTPAVRAALYARLDDEHEEARHEALAGLARRGDASVVERLIRELEAGLSSLLVEAAAELGDVRLQAPLKAARADPEMTPWFAEALDEAIARCDPAAEV